MSLVFKCPVGASADVKELEYIAALLQTNDAEDDNWLNCSIEATDVKTYLLSRHGIEVTKEEVRKHIFNGLAGGDGADQCLDVTEIVAILLIPFLLKSVQQGKVDNAIISEPTDYDSKIFQDVFSIIMCDVFGSDKPKPLTSALLRQIFAEYEEIELISDENLIQEMMTMAIGSGDGLFDAEAFSRALTSDLSLYDTTKETSISTHYEDVFEKAHLYNEDAFEASTPTPVDIENDPDVTNKLMQNSKSVDSSVDGKSPEVASPVMLKAVYSFGSIDITIDAYRSMAQMVLSLVVFVAVIYYAPINLSLKVCSSETFGCDVANKILFWLYKMGQIMLTGTVIIITFNIGNDAKCNSIWLTIANLAVLGLFLSILYADIEVPVLKYIERQHYITFSTSCAIIGMLQIMNLIQHLIERGGNKYERCTKILTYFNRYKKQEHKAKQAAAFKVKKLVNNALKLHQYSSDQRYNLAHRLSSANDASTNALALMNYSRESETYETLGGIIWCFKLWWNNSFGIKDGIFLNTRIAIGMYLLFTYIFTFSILSGFTATSWINNYERNLLDDPITPDELIDPSGEDTLPIVAFFAIFNPNMDVIEPVRKYLPKAWMLRLGAFFAILLPTLVISYIFVNLLPSYITTILKFRTGVLGSLHEPLFKSYRANIYNMAYMIGVMIWSPLIMALLVTFIVFLGIFFVVWQVTRHIIFGLLGIVIGLIVTILTKKIFVYILFRLNHAAFYRRRVLLNNIATIALECWHIGITLFSAISRMIKLMIVTFAFLGRIDRPILAEDISKFNVLSFGAPYLCLVFLDLYFHVIYYRYVAVLPEFDSYPHLFRQSILHTEAHRHPYIERLGLMYMMKLRHGEKFGKQAGSTWRLLFVFALMPWLRKYRIPDGGDFDEKNILDLLGTESSKNYVSKLEAEIDALKLEIEELKANQRIIQ